MRSVAVLTLFVLCACAGGHTAQAAWSAAVVPGVSGEENTIEVHDPARADRAMSVTLRMTSMEMPPLRVVLTRDATGVYRAEHVQFAMSGAWELDAPGHRTSVTIR